MRCDKRGGLPGRRSVSRRRAGAHGKWFQMVSASWNHETAKFVSRSAADLRIWLHACRVCAKSLRKPFRAARDVVFDEDRDADSAGLGRREGRALGAAVREADRRLHEHVRRAQPARAVFTRDAAGQAQADAELIRELAETRAFG